MIFYYLIGRKKNDFCDQHGADTENRTRDLTLTKGALYQLSHIST